METAGMHQDVFHVSFITDAKNKKERKRKTERQKEREIWFLCD